MQDRKAPVFVAATCNNVRPAPELIRKDDSTRSSSWTFQLPPSVARFSRCSSRNVSASLGIRSRPAGRRFARILRGGNRSGHQFGAICLLHRQAVPRHRRDRGGVEGHSAALDHACRGDRELRAWAAGRAVPLHWLRAPGPRADLDFCGASSGASPPSNLVVLSRREGHFHSEIDSPAQWRYSLPDGLASTASGGIQAFEYLFPKICCVDLCWKRPFLRRLAARVCEDNGPNLMKKNIELLPNIEGLFGTRDENLRVLEDGLNVSVELKANGLELKASRKTWRVPNRSSWTTSTHRVACLPQRRPWGDAASGTQIRMRPARVGGSGEAALVRQARCQPKSINQTALPRGHRKERHGVRHRPGGNRQDISGRGMAVAR